MSCVGDVPHVIHNHDVAGVKVAGSVVDVLVEDVGQAGAVGGAEVQALGPGVRHAEEQAIDQAALEVGLHRVVDRTSRIFGFNDGGVALVRAECVGRLDGWIGLDGAGLQLVDVGELLQMEATAADIGEGESADVVNSCSKVRFQP